MHAVSSAHPLFSERIAAFAAPPEETLVTVEVGPAAGNLSRALLSRGHAKVVLVEKDERFRPVLDVPALGSH